MKNKLFTVLAAGVFLGTANNSSAAVISLDFEGIGDLSPIGNYYNGGGGTNYGITFSDNSLALIDSDVGGSGNIGGEPSPSTVLFFLSGSDAKIFVSGGFHTGFSFWYSAISTPGSVGVYDVNHQLLANLVLPVTPSNGGDPHGDFSPFYQLGLGFTGTASYASFAGVQNQIVFDNITFGSVTPLGSQTDITLTGSPHVAAGLALGTLNPVFDGGTLQMDSDEATYSQGFTINGNGGTIDQYGFISTFSGVFSDDIGGSGPLYIINGGSGGEVIFTGANTYSSTTTIQNGATVAINGSFNGPVIVNLGGTLQGTGTINNSVNVSGSLSPGNSPGTLHVAGTVTMLSGSTMPTDIDGLGTGNGAGNYDRLLISGAGHQFVLGSNVTLSPVLRVITAPATNTFVPSLGDTFHIVSAAGGISGRFAVVTPPVSGLPVDSRLYPFYDIFGNHNIDLRLIPLSWNSYLTAHGGNENAQSVGSVLDQLIASDTAANATLTQQELLYSVAGASAAQLPGLATALAGEVHAAMAAEIPLSALWVQSTVSDRLEQAPQSGPCKPAGNGFWLAASRNWEKWNGDSFASAFNADRNQYAFGFDMLAGKNVRLGAGYSYANIDVKASYEARGSVTEQLAFLYGQYDAGAAVIEGIASVGPTTWETSRPDPIGLTSQLTTNDTGLSSMAGVTVRVPMTKNCVSIQPYASAVWVHEDRSAVNEGQNTPAALSLGSYNMNGSRLMAGVSLGSESRNPMLAPVTFSLSLGGGIDSQNLANPHVDASLADTAFTIVSPGVSRTFFQTKASATLRLAKEGYFFLNYAGLFRSGADSQGLEAGMKFML